MNSNPGIAAAAAKHMLNIALPLLLAAVLTIPSPAQIPEVPNRTSPEGNREGLWCFLLDEHWNIVNDTLKASFYRTAFFEDGKPKGIVMDYYLSGRKKFEGRMLSIDPDIYDGRCRWYYPEGYVEWEVSYANGKKEGVETGYYRNGYKKGQFNYSKGVVQGLCKTWYENGHVEWEIQYKDGVEDGYSVCWYANGVKKQETRYINGKKNGLEIENYPSGARKTEAPFKNGLKHGVVVDFYENGVMKRELPVLNGVQQGVALGRYENGDKMFMIPYKDGMRHGEGKAWDKNGNLSTRTWINDIPQKKE